MVEKMSEDNSLEDELKTGKGISKTLKGLDKMLWKLDSLQSDVFDAVLDARGGHGDRAAISGSISTAKAYVKEKFENVQVSATRAMQVFSGILGGGAAFLGTSLNNLLADNNLITTYYNSLNIIIGGCIGYVCPNPNAGAIYDIDVILFYGGNTVINAAVAVGSLALTLW